MAVLKAVDPDPVHAEATETVEEVTETEKTEEAQEIREIRADSEIFPEKNRHPDLDINHIFFFTGSQIFNRISGFLLFTYSLGRWRYENFFRRTAVYL